MHTIIAAKHSTSMHKIRRSKLHFIGVIRTYARSSSVQRGTGKATVLFLYLQRQYCKFTIIIMMSINRPRNISTRINQVWLIWVSSKFCIDDPDYPCLPYLYITPPKSNAHIVPGMLIHTAVKTHFTTSLHGTASPGIHVSQ